MTNLQKKAIQHCIDSINNMKPHSIYSVLNDILSEQKIPKDQQIHILRETNNVICNSVTEPLAEIRRWLESIINV
jgi:hypothetical protein